MDTIITQALQLLAAELREGLPIREPDYLKAMLRLKYGTKKIEYLGGILLDQQNKIIEEHIFERGIENRTVVYLKKIVQRLFKKHATGLILFHNHPSGTLEFSKQDLDLTKRLRDVLGELDIRLVDHVLVTCAGSLSACELRLL